MALLNTHDQPVVERSEDFAALREEGSVADGHVPGTRVSVLSKLHVLETGHAFKLPCQCMQVDSASSNMPPHGILAVTRCPRIVTPCSLTPSSRGLLPTWSWSPQWHRDEIGEGNWRPPVSKRAASPAAACSTITSTSPDPAVQSSLTSVLVCRMLIRAGEDKLRVCPDSGSLPAWADDHGQAYPYTTPDDEARACKKRRSRSGRLPGGTGAAPPVLGVAALCLIPTVCRSRWDTRHGIGNLNEAKPHTVKTFMDG